jgi:hypothetical protein
MLAGKDWNNNLAKPFTTVVCSDSFYGQTSGPRISKSHADSKLGVESRNTKKVVEKNSGLFFF